MPMGSKQLSSINVLTEQLVYIIVLDLIIHHHLTIILSFYNAMDLCLCVCVCIY